jgi:hypothetical protein
MFNRGYISKTAALVVGAAVLFGLGYLFGRGHGTTRVPVNARTVIPVSGSPESHRVQSDAPLALPAMKKAVVLEEQNPDSYRALYLNKRYRVVGKAQKIVGTTYVDADATAYGYSGPAFRVSLESWDLPYSKYPLISEPDLAFIDLPNEIRLRLRPGQQIDANCTLVGHMTFRYCKLNRDPTK